MEEYQIEKIYRLDTLASGDSVAELESILRKTKGVNAGEVLLNESKIKIVFDETMISSDEIKSKIEKMGFEIVSEE